MRGLFAVREASDGDDGFWDWVRENTPATDATTQELIRFVSAANERLHALAPGLAFEAGAIGASQPCIVISADGIRDLFPAVESLVAAAGPIPGWQIHAFRQPRDPSDIDYGGKTFRPSDVWFEAYRIDGDGGGEIGLNLHVTGFDPSNPSIEGGAAFIFLDAVLGEHAVATKIGPIDFFPLAADPAAEGLRPILELRGVVGALKPDPTH